MLRPHSVILWLGDLNYRIEELDVEKVKALIEEKAFQTLYAYDQVQMGTVPSSGSCSSAVRGEPHFSFPSLGGFPEDLMSTHACIPSAFLSLGSVLEALCVP